jgi:hypothetical protein
MKEEVGREGRCIEITLNSKKEKNRHKIKEYATAEFLIILHTNKSYLIPNISYLIPNISYLIPNISVAKIRNLRQENLLVVTKQITHHSNLSKIIISKIFNSKINLFRPVLRFNETIFCCKGEGEGEEAEMVGKERGKKA